MRVNGEEGRGDRAEDNRADGGRADDETADSAACDGANGDAVAQGWAARDRASQRAVGVERLEAELDDLAGRAVADDHAALNRLLALVQPVVVRYCRAQMGAGIGLLTPDDVAQEVLVAVCGALGRYRAGSGRIMAFIYGIAHNKVVDAFRAAERDKSKPTEGIPDVADETPGPDDEAVLGSEVAELRGLLARLPPAQREVLVLRVALRFTAEETARTIGSTPGAVRVTQYRAMTKLRAMVVGRDQEEPP